MTSSCRFPPKRALAARLQIALDVARGMAALEGNDPPIVHRDLKPSNIFIDSGQCSNLVVAIIDANLAANHPLCINAASPATSSLTQVNLQPVLLLAICNANRTFLSVRHAMLLVLTTTSKAYAH